MAVTKLDPRPTLAAAGLPEGVAFYPMGDPKPTFGRLYGSNRPGES